MAVVGELMILMAGNNAPLMASLASSEAAVKGFGATTATHGRAASAGLGVAALGVGAFAAVLGGVSLKAAGDFQEQMGIINTIAHQTPDFLGETADGIREMAVSTGQPLSDMTKAFYDLLSAGVPITQAMTVLGQSSTLAIGGLATTAQTVDLLTTAMNTYHLNAKGSAAATDQFALAIQNGKVTADQIAATFSDIAPIAKTAGIGIDEIAAGYAHFTANGVPAAEFTTQMNRAIVELLKPGKALSELQEKTGKNFADIAAHKGLVEAMQEMRDAAEKAHVPFQNLFGRLEGFKFALQTTGPEFKNYEAQLTQMHHAGGTAAGQAAERMGTFNRQTAILGESVNSAFISIGNTLLPTVTGIVTGVSGIVKMFTAWSEKNPGLATTILGVVGGVAALIAGVVFLGPILGAIGTVIGVIASPLLLVGGAILALAGHFGLLGSGAQDMVDGVLAQVGQMASAFVAWISPMIPVALAMLGDMAGRVIAWLGAQVPIWVAQLGRWGQAFLAWIGPMIPPALAMLGQMAGQLFAWVSAQVPVWVGQLGRWAAAFVDWIAPLIPPLLGKLGQIAAAGIAWVVAQLPKWTAALLKWVEAFLAWLAPMIPPLIAELGKFAAALIGWLAQQVPVIGLALLQLGQQFVAWVDNAIPGLVAALARFLGQVLAWFQSIAPTIAKAASDLGGSIADNLIKGIGDIGKAIGDKLNTIPGVSLVGGVAGNVAGAAAGLVPIPHGATGGYVAGTGLAVIHAGEQLIPAGRGGGGQSLTHTTVVQLDGQTIGQVVEKLLFNSASGFSSGFAGSSVTD